jgi:hypothetical protein
MKLNSEFKWKYTIHVFMWMLIPLQQIGMQSCYFMVAVEFMAAQKISPITLWINYLLGGRMRRLAGGYVPDNWSQEFWKYKIHSELLGFGLFPSSRVRESKKHDVSETGSVPETSCLLFSRTPDDGKIKDPSNSECYTPSSEPFRIYL